VDATRGPSFVADQDKGAQRGFGRPIPPLVSEIQAATTNAGARPQGGLTPDFLALSIFGSRGCRVFTLFDHLTASAPARAGDLHHRVGRGPRAAVSVRDSQQRLPAQAIYWRPCYWRAPVRSSAAAVKARRAPEHEAARLAKLTLRESEAFRLVIDGLQPRPNLTSKQNYAA
jgi:hypothetical protein